jgi:hypothetical protein
VSFARIEKGRRLEARGRVGEPETRRLARARARRTVVCVWSQRELHCPLPRVDGNTTCCLFMRKIVLSGLYGFLLLAILTGAARAQLTGPTEGFDAVPCLFASTPISGTGGFFTIKPVYASGNLIHCQEQNALTPMYGTLGSVLSFFGASFPGLSGRVAQLIAANPSSAMDGAAWLAVTAHPKQFQNIAGLLNHPLSRLVRGVNLCRTPLLWLPNFPALLSDTMEF